MASILPDVTQPTSLLTNLAYAISILFLSIIATHILTTTQSSLALAAKNKAHNGASPPIVPYNIPFLGNLIPFLSNTPVYISKLRRNFGTRIPLRIKLGTQNLIYVSSPSTILTLFRNTKDLSTTRFVIMTMEKMFGAPKSIRKILEGDNTGFLKTPVEGSNPLAEKDRYWYQIHRILHGNLQGTPLDDLSTRFIQNLEDELKKLCDGLEGDWLEFADFYEVVRGACFKASVVAICGPHIFNLTPNLADLFWNFDNNTIKLFKGIPRWVIPKSYRARDRYIAAVKKWNLLAKEHAGECKDVEWDEFCGSKVMRERARDLAGIEGMNEDIFASQTAGMIWATNTNIIPTVFWCLIDTITRPSLLSSVLQEISSTYVPSIASSHIPLNTHALQTSPLLQSIFSEELRLRSSVMIQRTPKTDFDLGPYKIPHNTMMIASSWHEQNDPSIWNESPTLRSPIPHPVTEFWAERFLVYDDDPYSGPSVPSSTSKPSHDPNTKPRFTTTPVNGSFIPFGGGKKICPGRFYAKYEAICGMALFLEMFEVELDGGAGEVGMDMDFFAFGVMPPMSKIKGRMRRRSRG